MSECKNGEITGTNTVDHCGDFLNRDDCNADTEPWGYSCCRWSVPKDACVATNCPGLDNPDECPGCNWCKDVDEVGYYGWEITTDRGSIPQDIYVDGTTAPQAQTDCGITIPNGRILYTGDFMGRRSVSPLEDQGHIWFEPGGKLYWYGFGNTPAP